MTKLWGGRFAKSTDALIEKFNSSIVFDARLYRQDIAGSAAHAKMLAKCGIISAEDLSLILGGLDEILVDIERGKFEFDEALEDIHMNIEQRLTEKIGEAGRRLHTARSRNDQVALDTHMYLREEILAIAALIFDLEKSLIETAAKFPAVIMPGYTHLQRAQPILFAHHLMAYFFMLERDFSRLRGVWQAADIMPLGAGALAGTTFPIDRHFVAEELKFGRIYENSLDAVSDRDYILQFLSFASILMMHLSRLSEEMILWASSEFSFIELDDAHCTGSSMMPQKKNPDMPELIRGKTGRVFGHLTALLTVMKGLPLAYNKDMQEDKEGLFDTVDTVKASLSIYAALIRKMEVNGEQMEKALNDGFLNATDMADYLVKKGLPFRNAHEVTGKCVAYALGAKKTLSDLTLEEFRQFSPLFAADISETLKAENCINNRDSFGGTSPRQVKLAIATAWKIMDEQRETLEIYEEIIGQ